MQITDKIRQSLGDWTDMFAPFIQSEQWDNIFNTLKTLSMNKRVVIPKSPDVFKSFELCSRHKVKAIVFLMDPYPSTTKDGELIADGVPMSCKGKSKLQPTLEKWYMGIENDFGNYEKNIVGFIPDMDQSGDIDFLLTEEGVLLLNSCLTCEKDKPGSHLELWTPFMKFFIEEIVNKYYKGLPIVLCGTQAQKLERFINPIMHYSLKVEHPAASSYNNRFWEHQEMFRWINKILKMNNGEEYQIRWYRTVDEMKNKNGSECKEKKPYSTSKEPLKDAKSLGLPWDN